MPNSGRCSLVDDHRKPTQKLGIFYDGGWYTHVSDYYEYVHPLRTRPSLHGLRDAMRWHHHITTGQPFTKIEATEAHYVRGRPAGRDSPTGFERALHATGVIRHDVQLRPGQEKGADVELALQLVERALVAALDVVVLVSGDADLVPAVTRLTGKNVHVIVPYISVAWTDGGVPRSLSTARNLAAAATEAPALDCVLVEAMDDSGYPGVFPFVDRPATDTGKYGAVHTGRVTRWRDGEPYAFLVDTHGQSWWMSKDSLLGNTAEIDVNTWVRFQGSPHPAPGQKVPTAYSVRRQDKETS